MKLPVTNDKFQSGIGKLGDEAAPFMLVDFEALFDREWTTDVHFACYSVVEPGADAPTSDPFPRLRKTALSSIREVGGNVVLLALSMDFDLKDQPDLPPGTPLDDEGKPVWTTALLDSFTRGLSAVDADLAERNIAAPLVYTTTHGARFVHRLSRPVNAEDGEDLLRGLQKVYGDLGMVMDPLVDWTRLFRAPKVRRSGKPTWSERWFTLRWGTGATDPAAVDPITRAAAHRDTYAPVKAIDSDKPTPEQAFLRLHVATSTGQKKTEMHKVAERVLRGTEAYGPIFEMRSIADAGSRDQTLIRLVGQATTFLLGPLSGTQKFDPEDIYALFLAPVQDLDPDSGTPDWTESLWRKVCTCYEREVAKLAAQKEKQEQRQEEAAGLQQQMLEVARQTCEIPELHSPDEVTAQTALRRLMLVREPSGRFRAMKPDGGYTRGAVSQSGLHFLIGQAAGIGDIIPLVTENDRGKLVAVSEQSLARQATDVQRVEGAAGIDRSHVIGRAWDDLVLRVALYRRNPELTSFYSQEVDDWLSLLTHDRRALLRWLAYALDFEGGPICALSLAGAPEAGKGLLAQGLVEVLEHPVRADKTVLVSQFNASLARTPFLVVDEGLPAGQNNIADTFRAITAGDPIRVEEKFQSSIEVRNPMRVLFLANNDDIIGQLAARRVNTENDQVALAQRILHLEARAEARMHLRGLGGIEHTRGWVQGAGGQPSNYKLARHLLHLYENRRELFGPPDLRLLVEGRNDTEVVQNLRIAGKVHQAIATAIVHALENPVKPSIRHGISLDADRLLITTGAIEDQHREQHHSLVQLSAGSIGNAMRNLCSPGVVCSERMRHTNLVGEVLRQRWWDVDVKLLWNFAEEAGYPRKRLEKIYNAQFGKGAADE